MARARTKPKAPTILAQEMLQSEDYELAQASARIAWNAEWHAMTREKEFRQRYRRPLDMRFPYAFKQAMTLLQTANPALRDSRASSESFLPGPLPFKLTYRLRDHRTASASRDVLCLRLGEIVDRYRQRHSSAEYVSHVREGMASARAAEDQTDKLIKCLKRLDAAHVEMLMFVAHELGFSGTGFAEFLGQMARCRSILSLCGEVLTSATQAMIKRPGQGRRRIPYVLAACELVNLWEELTYSRAPHPKGVAKGKDGDDEAVQPSTAFVDLGLGMIDPAITVSNTMTCLKQVFSIRSEYDKAEEQNIKRGYSWLRYAERRLSASAIAARRFKGATSGNANIEPKRAKRVGSRPTGRRKSK